MTVKKALIVAGLYPEVVSFNVIEGVNGTTVVKFEKQLLKKGIFAHPQFPNDPSKNINYNDKIFDDIIAAFDAKALDNVPVIVGSHDEGKTKDIGGKVTKLFKKKDGLYSEMELTDEDVVAAINAKTSDGKGVIDEVSVSLAPVTDDEGNSFPIALWHVAIVTHAFYKGMNSFEQLAASLEGQFDKILYSLNAEDLQQKTFKIRRAFNHQKSTTFDPIFVEEIHEDFLIAINDSTGELFKFSYSDTDEGVKFGDPVKVRKTFEVIKTKVKGMNMPEGKEEKTTLELLAEKGIKVDSVSELKDEDVVKLLATSDPKPEPKPVPAIKKEDPSDADKILTGIKAAFDLDDKEDKDVDVVKLVASLRTAVDEQGEEIKSLKATVVTVEAEKAVDDLLRAGKMIPAQKDMYIEMYQTNKSMFEKFVATNTVIVDTTVKGQTTEETEYSIRGEGDIDVSDLAGEEKESERHVAAAKAMNTNGKSNKGGD